MQPWSKGVYWQVIKLGNLGIFPPIGWIILDIEHMIGVVFAEQESLRIKFRFGQETTRGLKGSAGSLEWRVSS